MLKKYVSLLFLGCSLSFSAQGQGFQVYDQVVDLYDDWKKSNIMNLAQITDTGFVASFGVARRMTGYGVQLHFYNAEGQNLRQFSSAPSSLVYLNGAFSLLEPLPNGEFLTNFKGVFFDSVQQRNFPSEAVGRFNANENTIWITDPYKPSQTFSKISFIDSTNFISYRSKLNNNVGAEYCKRNHQNQVSWCFSDSLVQVITDSLEAIKPNTRFYTNDFKANADSFYVHLKGEYSNYLVSFSNATGQLGRLFQPETGFQEFLITPSGFLAFYQKTNPFLPSLKRLVVKKYSQEWQELSTLNVGQWLSADETVFLKNDLSYTTPGSIHTLYHPVQNTVSMVYGRPTPNGFYDLGLLTVDTTGSLIHKVEFGNITTSFLPSVLKPTTDGGVLIGLPQQMISGYDYTLGPSVILKVSVNGSIATNVFEIENSLTLYPNPAKDHFYLQGLKPNHRATRIALLSLNGRLIAELEPPASDGRVTLPAKVKNGLYLLRFYTNAEPSVWKLKVNR